MWYWGADGESPESQFCVSSSPRCNVLDAGLGTLSDLQVEWEEVEEDMDTIFITNTISNHIALPEVAARPCIDSEAGLDPASQRLN